MNLTVFNRSDDSIIKAKGKSRVVKAVAIKGSIASIEKRIKAKLDEVGKRLGDL